MKYLYFLLSFYFLILQKIVKMNLFRYLNVFKLYIANFNIFCSILVYLIPKQYASELSIGLYIDHLF